MTELIDQALGRVQTFSGTIHDKMREALSPSAYGVGWNLTDILRSEDDSARAVCLDSLAGFQKGKFIAELRSPILCELRTANGKPFEVQMSRPTGAPKGFNGQFYLPKQSKWRTVATLQAVSQIPIVGDVEWQSAVWLLNKYGWMAREHGKERWRYSRIWPFTWSMGKKKIAEEPTYIDQWALVEQAFVVMHPTLGPTKEPKIKIPTPEQTVQRIELRNDDEEEKSAKARAYHKAWREKRKALRAKEKEKEGQV